MAGLRDYSAEKRKWLTAAEGNYYPDSLEVARTIYAPVLKEFGELLGKATDSVHLFKLINEIKGAKRTQVFRVFRKYVSPATPVEDLKKKSNAADIIAHNAAGFRDIKEVRDGFKGRPEDDDAMVAVLNEYRERGKKGYTLTEAFFDWFEANLSDQFTIEGPIRAGKDVNLKDVFNDYPRDERPIDFVIRENGKPLIVGAAHYDSDRGGGQEDDRPSNYRDLITEVLGYADASGKDLKLLFINDGPGLALGTMWRDYCSLEDQAKGRAMVVTLKMLEDRVTPDWIRDPSPVP